MSETRAIRSLDDIRFGSDGLVPVVVQDATSRRVCTLAYANREALALTLETGQSHFYSRSRQEIWHKGATSGHTQRVRAIFADCDADALLYIVEPAGPACHTGAESCFYQGLYAVADASDDEDDDNDDDAEDDDDNDDGGDGGDDNGGGDNGGNNVGAAKTRGARAGAKNTAGDTATRGGSRSKRSDRSR